MLQARNILLQGITLQTSVANSQGLVLQSCRDSIFRDVKMLGPWESGETIPTDYSTDIGLQLNQLSGSVKTQNNLFERCEVVGFAYGVISNWDINNNHWRDCIFESLGYGMIFGVDMVLGAPSTGQSTGPVNNRISYSSFRWINNQGIWIHNGTNNSSSDNSFAFVGNDGNTEASPSCSIIKYANVGNAVSNDYFARTKELSYTTANLTGKVYYPEVETQGSWTWRESHFITIVPGTDVKAIRLPFYKNQGFELEYTLESANYSATRSGTLYITVDANGSDLEWNDDFHFAGAEGYLESIKFTVGATDENGDATNDTISISYTSTMPGDDQTKMTFKATSKQP